MEDRVRILCDVDKRWVLITKFGYDNVLFLSPTIEEVELLSPKTEQL